MREYKPDKLLKIAALLAFIGFGLTLLPWMRVGAQSQAQPQDHLDVLGYQATLQEKLGRDDEVSFVIHFGGDIHGNLDACG